jgi:hypothetical protein
MDIVTEHDPDAEEQAAHQAARDRRNEPDRWPTATIRESALAARIATLEDAVARGCRHCGQPVELGIDGALLTARLGFDDPVPAPYAAHLRCQVEVLDQLAEDSRESIARWRVSAPAGVLALSVRARTRHCKGDARPCCTVEG